MYTCSEVLFLKELFALHLSGDVAVEMKWFAFFNCSGLV